MVRVVGIVIVVIRDLGLLPLGVLLVFHPPVLEPYLHLPLGQVEVPRQFPPLLLGDVGVEEELLLKLQGLELGIRFALLADGHLARPLQGVVADSHARHPNAT